MLLSKKILISLLVLNLANPALARIEREQEDANEPYYYIAASIVLGAVGLGVFFKRDAIKGWRKKEPGQPLDTVDSSPTDDSNTPNEGSVQRAVEGSSIVMAAVVSHRLADEPTTQSTTTASSTEATKLEETFELKETVTVTETPLPKSSQASKKPERGQPSQEFLARQKFLEQHLAQIRGTEPARLEPTVSRVTTVTTKSEEQEEEPKTESVRERARQLAAVLGKGSETPTTSSESTDTTDTTAPECLVTDLPPSQFPQNPLYYQASDHINSNGDIQIFGAAENTIEFHSDSLLGWIFVSNEYEELDDFMGVSFPDQLGFIYCFVNPNADKVIFPHLQKYSMKFLITYSGRKFLWWRIQGASHSTICVEMTDHISHYNAPEETTHVESPALKEVKSKADLKREKKEKEKKEKEKKEKQDKKNEKGKDEKKHIWSRKK